MNWNWNNFCLRQPKILGLIKFKFYYRYFRVESFEKDVSSTSSSLSQRFKEKLINSNFLTKSSNDKAINFNCRSLDNLSVVWKSEIEDGLKLKDRENVKF